MIFMKNQKNKPDENYIRLMTAWLAEQQHHYTICMGCADETIRQIGHMLAIARLNLEQAELTRKRLIEALPAYDQYRKDHGLKPVKKIDFK